MTDIFPAPPTTGTPLSPIHDSPQARTLLALRRSTPIKCIAGPGPTPEAVDELLRIAARVPDHRRLEPWRFIVFEGDARQEFGQKLATIHAGNEEAASAEDLETERQRMIRAPVVIAVISAPDADHKTPVWEQELSAGAACFTLLLAANAAGWAGAWLTEWLAFDAGVANLLGLETHERIAGFIYVGTAIADPPERPRPDMVTKVTRWLS